MLFDTHCHLNFNAFEKNLEKNINQSKESGIEKIIVPGTDIETSIRAVEISEKFEGIYASAGIHPHHIMKIKNERLNINDLNLGLFVKKIENLLKHPKVLAVGEIGLDYHVYKKTKYKDYQIDEEFISLQKYFFIEQLKLSKKYYKSAIIHNREAKKDLIKILSDYESLITNYRLVFHCCEPDLDLLDFAIEKKIFIGIDGDIVYSQKKQNFLKKVPLDLLVLETDAPFLSPFKKFPNEPKNLKFIADFIADFLGISFEKIKKITTKNACFLFKI